MQKTFVAIALALTLSCAVATYTPTNFAKQPLVVVQDNETTFTNMSTLYLASITPGNVYLVSGNVTVNTQNASANTWTIWYRQLDAKALTLSATTLNATVTSPLIVFYYNNYAFSFTMENDTGIPAIRVYQTSLNGGAVLPRLTISTNNNATFQPTLAGSVLLGKTFYVFYRAAEKTLNVTNFQLGGAVGTNEWTMTSNFDTPASLSVVWGESLGSSQAFACWVENGALKDAQVDLSKGALVNPQTITGYAAGYSCSAFATDKKWFGDLCTTTNISQGTISYYIRSNTTSLALLANTFINTSSLAGTYAYGPYLAIFYTDIVTNKDLTTQAYEIWNLDTTTTFKNRTNFLTIDTNSTYSPFRVQSGGLFGLMYNKKIVSSTGALSSVQVGLILGSSYLATIFGFLLTIIAGLFLF